MTVVVTGATNSHVRNINAARAGPGGDDPKYQKDNDVVIVAQKGATIEAIMRKKADIMGVEGAFTDARRPSTWPTAPPPPHWRRATPGPHPSRLHFGHRYRT